MSGSEGEKTMDIGKGQLEKEPARSKLISLLKQGFPSDSCSFRYIRRYDQAEALCHHSRHPLSKYCLKHILSDPSQLLYRPCCCVMSQLPPILLDEKAHVPLTLSLCGLPASTLFSPPICTKCYLNIVEGYEKDIIWKNRILRISKGKAKSDPLLVKSSKDFHEKPIVTFANSIYEHGSLVVDQFPESCSQIHSQK
eukprot:gnl/Carplike_NY0171/7680_a10608_190.p1 GENE.gnl/Carplike_NY0171/7680_a10608_190~~gnl/Carplike_NY0171/7680_a10608_190.p1  ORF type:complete len:196 (+),score=16.33 gnl/Carplike_NY0171/7680_a10608_190:45-632(+)